jgi:hypothetical protein
MNVTLLYYSVILTFDYVIRSIESFVKYAVNKEHKYIHEINMRNNFILKSSEK